MFTITSETKIILYGAATFGSMLYKKMRSLNHNIIGFIDKRSDEITQLFDLPVWNLENIPSEIKNMDYCIIIAVKNVFEHSEIVECLLKLGYDRCIFKPYAFLVNNYFDEDKRLSDIYDEIVAGKEVYGISIPKTTIERLGSLKSVPIVKQDGEYVYAYVPLSLIYTNKSEGNEQQWSNINIYALFPHIDLFKYFSGNINYGYEAYVDSYCTAGAEKQGVQTTDEWKINVLLNRRIVYEQMELFFNIDETFFIRNAPQAKWNERGYFNLVSGKHRTAFLAAKNLYYIILKITEEDYKKFLNERAVISINYLIQNNLLSIKAPIPNPYFYYYKPSLNFYYQILSAIVTFISRNLFEQYKEVNFENLNILDVFENNFLAANFLKMGADVSVLNCIQNNETTEVLNKVQFIDKDSFKNRYKNSKKYNYVIVSNVLMDLFEEHSKNINSIYYIFFIPVNKRRELLLRYSDMKYEKILSKFFQNGLDYELIVLKNIDSI